MPELTRRYIVMSMAAEGPFDIRDPDGAFVLKPWKDPAAVKALEAYSRHCYPQLAAELAEWIAAIFSGPRVRGGVGGRNDDHMAREAALVRKAPAARRRRVKSKAVTAKHKPVKKKVKR